MTSHTGLVRIGVILLFVITFVVVGTLAPVLYAGHAPQNHFIEVHNFEAQNTSTDADEHLICFDRTVEKSTSGKVFAELYLVNGENSDTVEVGGETNDRYFQDGRHEVVTPLELPENLGEGEYRYLLVVRMELADGQVTRDFAFESDTFHINGNESEETSADFSCN